MVLSRDWRAAEAARVLRYAWAVALPGAELMVRVRAHSVPRLMSHSGNLRHKLFR
jgi:hypothetical protein